MNEKTPEEIAKELFSEWFFNPEYTLEKAGHRGLEEKIATAIRTERAATDELRKECNPYLKAAKSIRNGDTSGYYLNEEESGKNTIWMLSNDKFKEYYALGKEVDELRKENTALRIFAKKAVEILREFRNLYVTEKDIDTLLTDPAAKELMK